MNQEVPSSIQVVLNGIKKRMRLLTALAVFNTIALLVVFLGVGTFLVSSYGINEKLADSITNPDLNANFRNLPLERKIQLASVIVQIEYKNSDTERPVVTKILKIQKNTNFPYSIGQEFPKSNIIAIPPNSPSDGQVIFFVGQPPVIRFAANYYLGKIPIFNDMTMMDFAAKVDQLH